jgi:hypothetical protein
VTLFNFFYYPISKRAHFGGLFYFLFFIGSIFPLNLLAVDFEYQTQWKNLNFTHGFITDRGIIKNGEFYLNPQKHWDPKQEWMAFEQTIEHSLKSKLIDTRLCHFPMRTYWVWKNSFGNSLEEFKKFLSPCKDLQQFLDEFAVSNISIIFTSYYSYAAASLFGHTFLRLERAGESGLKGQELLDVGISFGADVTTQNPILYAWDGLVGNFSGVITAVPYYYKVREYQSFEKRDLWSYRLKLSAEEKQFFLWQLWELGAAKLEYSFFFRNCSDIVLRVIQNVTAMSRVNHETFAIWDESFPFYVVPVDTIKSLQKYNLVDAPQYRPGQEKVWSQFFSSLPESLQKEIRNLIENENIKQWKANYQGTPEQLALILEGYVHYLDFSKAQELLKKDPYYLNERHLSLTYRSQLTQQANVQATNTQEVSPDKIHDTRRISLYGRKTEVDVADSPRQGIGLQYRFAFHDALDPSAGSLQGMSLEFLSLKGIYDTNQYQLHLEEIQLLNLMTFSPWNFWRQNPNYQVRVWWDQESYDSICTRCSAMHALISLGPAVEWKQAQATWLFYLHLQQQLTAMDRAGESFFWLAGPRAGFYFWYSQDFSWQLDFVYGTYLAFDSKWHERLTSEWRWHASTAQSWYAKTDLKNDWWGIELGTHFFY